MNFANLKSRIEALGQREWPAEWGQKEADEIGDFHGWCHRYRLEEPLPETDAAAFEQEHAVTLPGEYRAFLTELANGGAGPDYGIFPLGEGEEEPLWDGVLERLNEPFRHSEAWNDDALLNRSPGGGFIPDERYYADDIMAGAMPIATRGCALDYWLVVSGPRAGEMWFDKRTDGEGVEPVCDAEGNHLTFGPWYLAWLEGAEARFGGA